ncbi:uncharacterized protein LOC127655912 isoform X1 [Xyrauchen texanus]|uniref:uncharacterized protein LOC127655912 isoform X1 n=1 Tax=Xyrauchen texanus TaxID=154827 RepID=UPI0022418829|nr:uncharacterized protein LOC127655912 isoform X1 [Xyrauchen texanus]XP_051999945.1 uncharacterized protein LOC127655912 isoform X1 [Xyrauchen texanus]
MENASTTRITHYTDVGDADGSAEVPETTGDRRRGEAPRPVLQAMESIMPAASPGLTRLSPGLPKWNQVVKRGRQKRTEESQQGVRIGKSVLERRAAKIVVGTGAARDIKMITTKRAAIHNQGAEILASISLEEQAENSDNELSLVGQELLEIKKFIFTGRNCPGFRCLHIAKCVALCLPGIQWARILLLGVFDIETLVKSNLRGGESKVSKGGDGERRSGLDEIKVKAIMDAVMSKHSVSAGQIGTALNGKMAELRLAMSRKNVN